MPPINILEYDGSGSLDNRVCREYIIAGDGTGSSSLVQISRTFSSSDMERTVTTAKEDSTTLFTKTQNLGRFLRVYYDYVHIVPKNLKQFLGDLFLPIGFPHTVNHPKSYIQYQTYDAIQGLCSYLRGVVCTSAVLAAAGVGNAQATATSAAIQWATRDGCGMIGGLWFSYRCSKSMHFDSHVKEFRLLADILNDAALFLDMLAPLLLQLRLNTSAVDLDYVLYASIAATLCRSMCGVAAGATKNAVTAHFAKNNVADLSSKEGTQETLVSLVGMVLGIALARFLQSLEVDVQKCMEQEGDCDADADVAAASVIPEFLAIDVNSNLGDLAGYIVAHAEVHFYQHSAMIANWFVFLILTWIHIWANYVGVKTLRLCTLNRERCKMALDSVIDQVIQFVDNGNKMESDEQRQSQSGPPLSAFGTSISCRKVVGEASQRSKWNEKGSLLDNVISDEQTNDLVLEDSMDEVVEPACRLFTGCSNGEGSGKENENSVGVDNEIVPPHNYCANLLQRFQAEEGQGTSRNVKDEDANKTEKREKVSTNCNGKILLKGYLIVENPPVSDGYATEGFEDKDAEQEHAKGSSKGLEKAVDNVFHLPNEWCESPLQDSNREKIERDLISVNRTISDVTVTDPSGFTVDATMPNSSPIIQIEEEKKTRTLDVHAQISSDEEDEENENEEDDISALSIKGQVTTYTQFQESTGQAIQVACDAVQEKAEEFIDDVNQRFAESENMEQETTADSAKIDDNSHDGCSKKLPQLNATTDVLVLDNVEGESDSELETAKMTKEQQVSACMVTRITKGDLVDTGVSDEQKVELLEQTSVDKDDDEAHPHLDTTIKLNTTVNINKKEDIAKFGGVQIKETNADADADFDVLPIDCCGSLLQAVKNSSPRESKDDIRGNKNQSVDTGKVDLEEDIDGNDKSGREDCDLKVVKQEQCPPTTNGEELMKSPLSCTALENNISSPAESLDGLLKVFLNIPRSKDENTEKNDEMISTANSNKGENVEDRRSVKKNCDKVIADNSINEHTVGRNEVQNGGGDDRINIIDEHLGVSVSDEQIVDLFEEETVEVVKTRRTIYPFGKDVRSAAGAGCCGSLQSLINCENPSTDTKNEGVESNFGDGEEIKCADNVEDTCDEISYGLIDTLKNESSEVDSRIDVQCREAGSAIKIKDARGQASTLQDVLCEGLLRLVKNNSGQEFEKEPNCSVERDYNVPIQKNETYQLNEKDILTPDSCDESIIQSSIEIIFPDTMKLGSKISNTFKGTRPGTIHDILKMFQDEEYVLTIAPAYWRKNLISVSFKVKASEIDMFKAYVHVLVIQRLLPESCDEIKSRMDIVTSSKKYVDSLFASTCNSDTSLIDVLVKRGWNPSLHLGIGQWRFEDVKIKREH